MENATPTLTRPEMGESVIYQQTSVTELPRNVAEVIAIAKVMAASGFYPDARTAQQAAAIMLLGIQFGIPPAQALTAIHVVKGKPMLHYSAILSKVRQHPNYDYDIVTADAKKAELAFYRIDPKTGERTECGRSIFTDADAKRQGTQNMDKFPDTMLLARAASNGVKRYCPDVLNGMPVYTPGEIEPEEAYAPTAMPKSKALLAGIRAQDAEPKAVSEQEPEPVLEGEKATEDAIWFEETEVEPVATEEAPAEKH